MSTNGKNKEYVQCSHCTMQMPVGVAACPHCDLPAVSGGHAEIADQDGFINGMRDESKKSKSRLIFLLILVPALLLLYYGGGNLYRTFFGVKIVILENPDLLIRDVAVDGVSDGRVLRGTVLNNLADVPAVSLKSIGVKADVVMKDGKTYVKTLFPVGPLNEPGALLMGDSGNFELPIPDKNVREIRLGAEIIDLRGKKRF